MKLYLIKKIAEELHKPAIRKFEKRKVYSPFIDNIWGTDLGDMQLITKFNKGFIRMCYWYLYSICMGYSFKNIRNALQWLMLFKKC